MKSMTLLMPLLLVLPLADGCSDGDGNAEGGGEDATPAELVALCERMVICQGAEQKACEAEGVAGIKAAHGVGNDVCNALIEADLAMYGCLAQVEDCEIFNTATAVPEWDGQKVFVMMEDDAFLTDEGYRFFRPRQEAWYVIR